MQAGCCVRRVFYRGISFTCDAVLGTEQRDELHAVRVGEDVNCASSLRVHSCLIRDQADVFASQGRKILRLEDVNPGFRGPACLRRAEGGRVSRRSGKRRHYCGCTK